MHLYKKRVAYCETDAMGVVHHSNYLRYFEEARVDWMNIKELDRMDWGKESTVTLAVTEAHVEYIGPVRFNEFIEVEYQVMGKGPRVRFEYKIQKPDTKKLICKGYSVHVPLDEQLNICRPPEKFKELLRREKWIETWL